SLAAAPPRSSLFPYTTLFRSQSGGAGGGPVPDAGAGPVAGRAAPAAAGLGATAGRGVSLRKGLRLEADEQVARFYLRPRLDEYRSEEHTSELQSLTNIVCRLL